MKKFQAILFPVTNVTNVTKGKSMINHPFQHFQYETNVTGFFLVHVEINVTNVTNGHFVEVAWGCVCVWGGGGGGGGGGM